MSDDKLIMYHNPRCRTARGILAHLQAQGIEPKIVYYLETPPDEKALRAILSKINAPRPAASILRLHEKETLAKLGVDEHQDEETLIQAMLKEPILIQRPLLIKDDRAILARSSGAVDAFLDEVM